MRLSLLAAIFCLCPLVALSERGIIISGSPDRVALVIGNTNYAAITPLKNPRNDATALAEALGNLDFTVELLLDTEREQLVDALRRFRGTARKARQALIYYAGHGLEIDGRNFMVPVDAELDSDLDVAFEALPLDLFTRAAEGAEELSLVILDACRNNPFELQIASSDGSRSLSRGLAEVEPANNTLIAFAAQAGTVAKDGAAGRNSPFAAALLEVLAEPRVEVGFFFRKVRDGVHRRTGGQQVPYVYGSLPAREIFLNPGIDSGEHSASVMKPAIQQATRPVAVPTVNETTLDLVFWESIEDSDRSEDFAAYLEQFPEGTFAALAQARIRRFASAEGSAMRQDNAQPIRDHCPPTSGEWYVQNVTSDDTLFVRAGPNTQYEAIGELPFNGTGVTLERCVSGGYCEIRFGCIDGYAHGNYLGTGDAPDKFSDFAGKYTVRGRPPETFFNVRKGPGTSYDVVGVIPHDARDIFVNDCHPDADREDLWCALRWRSVSGWAFGGFLQRQSERLLVRD